MITEEEQLKKNTEHQKAMQQMQAISAYLDSLMTKIEETSKRAADANIIYVVVWVCWLVAGFFGRWADDMFQLFFVAALCYDFYRTILRARAYAEFRGAVKMLELLGMIPPPGERDEGKSKFWEEGVAIVKGWFTKKEAAKKEAYA